MAQSKYQSWWWRDLTEVCGEREEEGWFKNVVVWKVGNAHKVGFWEDVWEHNIKLKFLFPRLYFFSMDQDIKVGEVNS